MSIDYSRTEGLPAVRITARGGALRIFQMTDLHYHDFLPEKWNELWAYRELMQQHHPDFVVNTGDFFQQSDPRMAATIAAWFEKIIGSAWPWCLALGNHDQDAACPDPLRRLAEIDATLVSLPHTMYCASHEHMSAYPGAEFAEEVAALRQRGSYKIPEHDGEAAWDGFLGGNYVLLVHEGQKLCWEVFVLNSRSYLHVPDKVRHWMSETHAPGVPAVLFLHIPPRAWETLVDRGSYLGQAAEKVCFEGEDGSFHRFLREKMPDVVACFCGHDHVNDCAGLLDSVLYAYGRKSGTNGYGGYVSEPRPRDLQRGKFIRMGGTIIDLKLSPNPPAEGLRIDGPWWRYRGVGIRHVEISAESYGRDRFPQEARPPTSS